MKLDEIRELRLEVLQRLAELREKSAPVLNELARLEKLAASLEGFDQESQRDKNKAIGFVTGTRSISGKRALSASGDTTPHEEFTLPILESLYELGGKATRNAVLNRIEEKLKEQLKPKDLETFVVLPSKTGHLS